MNNSNDAIAAIVECISKGEWEEATILLLSCHPQQRKSIVTAVDGGLSEENTTRWQMISSSVVDMEEIVKDHVPSDTWAQIHFLCEDVFQMCRITASAW